MRSTNRTPTTGMDTKATTTTKFEEKLGIRCIQLNLRHSRAATSNLMKMVTENDTDILFIQQPYTIQGKLIGIPTKYRKYTAGEGRHRAAVVVTNNQLDATLLQQLSDEDMVAVEVIKGPTKIIAVSMYFDRERQIEHDLRKMDLVINHANDTGVLIAADSNARSTSWHDIQANTRGKLLEEFIMSKQLYIMNEDSCYTTFRNRLGSSNIDLALINSQLLDSFSGWEISDQDSVSDHIIIKYTIKPDAHKRITINDPHIRYKTNEERLTKFQGHFRQAMREKLGIVGNGTRDEDLDGAITLLLTEEGAEYEQRIDELNKALTLASNKSFPIYRTTRSNTVHKTVPWWSSDLTVLRKKTNALRRLYQRTINDEALREKRKTHYYECRATYSATIKQAKIRSWKDYCNTTNDNNPWNAVYKLATGKFYTNTQITTLKKPDGSFTADSKETLGLMMETFTPEDNKMDDNEHHKMVRPIALLPTDAPDDRKFTIDEVKKTVESMNNKKAPGDDGITGDIYYYAFKTLPKYITAIYNGRLKNGIFPTRWKRAKLIPIIKPGCEKSNEVSKYRPISLLNVGGKVLEKLLITRINHHLFTNDYASNNQYGFMPQRSTRDAAMAAREYIEEGFGNGKVVALLSLDVAGAFNSAWWPSILKRIN